MSVTTAKLADTGNTTGVPAVLLTTNPELKNQIEGKENPEKTYTESEFNEKIKELKEKYEKTANEKISEAEKLHKMSEQDKEDYKREKRIKELEEREKAILKRELKQTAKELLTEKNLPSTLLDLVNYESAETCKKSIESIEKAFNKAVSDGIDTKLKASGGTIMRDGGTHTESGVEAAFYKLNPNLRK